MEYMQLQQEALKACRDRYFQSCSSEFYPAFAEDTSTHTRKETPFGKVKTHVDHRLRDIYLCLQFRIQTLHDFAASIRTLRVRTDLELAPAIQSCRALFDVFEWLFAGTHDASRAHPVFRCLEVQNMAARIDRFAAERAEFGCILSDDLVSQ